MAITIKDYTNETTNPAKMACAFKMHSRSSENQLMNTSLTMPSIIKQDSISIFPSEKYCFTCFDNYSSRTPRVVHSRTSNMKCKKKLVTSNHNWEQIMVHTSLSSRRQLRWSISSRRSIVKSSFTLWFLTDLRLSIVITINFYNFEFQDYSCLLTKQNVLSATTFQNNINVINEFYKW